ncbi:Sm-like protein [Drosera capensis]
MPTFFVRSYSIRIVNEARWSISNPKSQLFFLTLLAPDATPRLTNSLRSTTPDPITMLFFSYFKEIVGREVVVELKNDLAIRGTLRSVDQYLNIKLENTRVVEQDKYPHMLSVRNCFIRGSVVRYVQLPPDGVDVELLHDATRREARGG